MENLREHRHRNVIFNNHETKKINAWTSTMTTSERQREQLIVGTRSEHTAHTKQCQLILRVSRYLSTTHTTLGKSTATARPGCSALSFSPLSHISQLLAANRSDESSLKHTLKSLSSSVLRVAVVLLNKGPSCLTPTGVGRMLSAATRIAIRVTNGTRPLARMVPPVRR